MVDFVNTTSRGLLGQWPLTRSSNNMKANASECLTSLSFALPVPEPTYPAPHATILPFERSLEGV
jgi:hypothetical protein